MIDDELERAKDSRDPSELEAQAYCGPIAIAVAEARGAPSLIRCGQYLRR
jgi:hypothetical protein